MLPAKIPSAPFHVIGSGDVPLYFVICPSYTILNCPKMAFFDSLFFENITVKSDITIIPNGPIRLSRDISFSPFLTLIPESKVFSVMSSTRCINFSSVSARGLRTCDLPLLDGPIIIIHTGSPIFNLVAIIEAIAILIIPSSSV